MIWVFSWISNLYSVYKDSQEFLSVYFVSVQRARYGFPMILHGKSVIKDKGANETIFTILNLRRGHSTLIPNIKVIVS